MSGFAPRQLAFVVVVASCVAACNALSGADDLALVAGGKTSSAHDATLPAPDDAAPSGNGNGNGNGNTGIGNGNGNAGGATTSDGSAPAKGGAAPPKQPIECDGNTCAGATPLCCIPRPARAECVPMGSACDGALLGCRGPQDCAAGDVCCGNSKAKTAQCTPAAACAPSTSVALCDGAADCPPGHDCSTLPSITFEHKTCE